MRNEVEATPLESMDYTTNPDRPFRAAFLTFSMILLLAGIAPDSTGSLHAQSHSPSETFTLKVGETKTFGNMQITLVAVSEDNRCPETIACVWQGNAKVDILLHYLGDDNTPHKFILNTAGVSCRDFNSPTGMACNYPNETIFKGQSVRLLVLEPGKQGGVEAMQDRYRATFTLRTINAE